MHESDLIKKLRKIIRPYLVERGFKKVKHEDLCFRKKMDGGYQQVDAIIVDYDGIQKVSFVFEIRNDAVEGILNRNLDRLPGSMDESTTLMVMHGIILGLPRLEEKQYHIKKKEDVVSCCEDFLSFLSTKGLAFLDRYSDLREMDRAINTDRLTPHPFFQDELDRACLGVVLAKLTERPSPDTIAAEYRSTVEYWPPPLVAQFDSLVRYLTAHSRAELMTGAEAEQDCFTYQIFVKYPGTLPSFIAALKRLLDVKFNKLSGDSEDTYDHVDRERSRKISVSKHDFESDNEDPFEDYPVMLDIDVTHPQSDELLRQELHREFRDEVYAKLKAAAHWDLMLYSEVTDKLDDFRC